MTALSYLHTQKGILRPILLICVAVCFVVAYFAWESPPLMPVFLAAGGVCTALAFAFSRLTVCGEGERLAVRFGPIPLFRKAILLGEITNVEKTRSTFLAGWGIHLTRKGWLWNIGGFDCVRIETGEKSTLVGTDDPEGLVAFLKGRIGANSERHEENR